MTDKEKDIKKAKTKFLHDNAKMSDRLNSFDNLCRLLSKKELEEWISEYQENFNRFCEEVNRMLEGMLKSSKMIEDAVVNKILGVINWGLILNEKTKILEKKNYQQFIKDCLCIETEKSIREETFKIVLNWIKLKGSTNQEEVKILIGALNINSFMETTITLSTSKPLAIGISSSFTPLNNGPILPTGPILMYETQHFIISNNSMTNKTIESLTFINYVMKEVINEKGKRGKGLISLFIALMKLLYSNQNTEFKEFQTENELKGYSGIQKISEKIHSIVINSLKEINEEEVIELLNEIPGFIELLKVIYSISMREKITIVKDSIEWYFRVFICQTKIEGIINSIEYNDFRKLIIEGIKTRIDIIQNNEEELMLINCLHNIVLNIYSSNINAMIQRTLVDTIKLFTIGKLERLQNCSIDKKRSTRIMIQILLYCWLCYNSKNEKEWKILQSIIKEYYNIPGVVDGISDIIGHILFFLLLVYYKFEPNQLVISEQAIISPVVEIPTKQPIDKHTSIPIQYEYLYSNLEVPKSIPFLYSLTNKWNQMDFIYFYQLMIKFFTQIHVNEFPLCVIRNIHIIIITSLLILIQYENISQYNSSSNELNLKMIYTDYLLSSLKSNDSLIINLTIKAFYQLYSKGTIISKIGYNIIDYSLESLNQTQLFNALENLTEVFSSLNPSSFILIPTILKSIQKLEKLPNVDILPEYDNTFIPYDKRLEYPSLNCGLKVITLLHSIQSLKDFDETALEIKQKKENQTEINFSKPAHKIYIELVKCYKHLINILLSTFCHTSIVWGITKCIIEIGEYIKINSDENNGELTTFMLEELIDLIIGDFQDLESSKVKNIEMCINYLAKMNEKLPDETIEYIIDTLCKLTYTTKEKSQRGSIVNGIGSFWLNCRNLIERISETTVKECFTIFQKNNNNEKKVNDDSDDKIDDVFEGKVIIENLMHSVHEFESGEDYIKDEENGINFVMNDRIYCVYYNENKEEVNIIVRDLVGKWGWRLKEIRNQNDIKEWKEIEKEKKENKIELISPRQCLIKSKEEIVKNKLDELVEEMEQENKELFEVENKEGFNNNIIMKEIEDMKEEFEVMKKNILLNTKDEIKKERRKEIIQNQIIKKDDAKNKRITEIIKTIIWLTNCKPNEKVPLKILSCKETYKLWKNKLDQARPKETHKLGIVYVGIGQFKEEEVLGNTKGSEGYNEFIKQLGEEINLKGWNKYCGKLDTKFESDGDKALYYCDERVEIIYHEVVKIPIKKGELIYQQKKRHVGNDRVHIIYCESKYYNPLTITSQFNNAHIIVYPINNMYRIQVYYKAGGSWGPLQNEMIVSIDQIGTLVRETAIYLDKASLSRFTTDKLMNQYISRQLIIERITKLAEPNEIDLLHLVNRIKEISSSL
ncbi:Rap/Ran GTPase-activating protein, putative [Entamoeba histolytica HM-1:IMSS-B]|uniref:Rap/Ran GTPase-activating protein, putative n=4 Tax=Entamoeba histolytica TaxID=5759 RepID=C4M8M0_ENTH1|nr:Rap/Ran GTPase-activating protein, putative [Entamoeba histolytica HM-1:IMSS]EAL44628.1 Rap/Ran GTPase-activating protein, putative [Entamoeba histolytica HM-1:IMSS]EMH77751.1 Rap/Ran GTPase-activating protein, putative [Entamoeba histolytica HM-1:IMSS-B]ENY65962.1 Rap/Ran GTPase-activating protein, putative [Entamoeba histolytica HM-1:IMSS-A]GAT97957.1 rap ran GTPase-activating protein putative [Entamoeba histolytica]|eukprot:XP_650014.1 Rap/Ran GTPase-activating protein, putative [Entamoeba histolytica HM-1:IMSS]